MDRLEIETTRRELADGDTKEYPGVRFLQGIGYMLLVVAGRRRKKWEEAKKRREEYEKFIQLERKRMRQLRKA